MKKIQSYLNQIKQVGHKVLDITHKNLLLIYLDIVFCTIIYGASPNNYLIFKFYNKNRKQRASFVTHRMSERLIRKYNEESKRDIFENKIVFARTFGKYFKREWADFKDMCFEEVFFFEKNYRIVTEKVMLIKERLANKKEGSL